MVPLALPFPMPTWTYITLRAGFQSLPIQRSPNSASGRRVAYWPGKSRAAVIISASA